MSHVILTYQRCHDNESGDPPHIQLASQTHEYNLKSTFTTHWYAGCQSLVCGECIGVALFVNILQGCLGKRVGGGEGATWGTEASPDFKLMLLFVQAVTTKGRPKFIIEKQERKEQLSGYKQCYKNQGLQVSKYMVTTHRSIDILDLLHTCAMCNNCWPSSLVPRLEWGASELVHWLN